MPVLGRLLVVSLALFAAPPLGAGERDVRVESTAAGITLAGTLAVPDGPGPFAAVLLITGNGPHTRDQRISDSPMFAMVGDHFVQRGMAVLRTDARGYGASTGPSDWEQYTTADRVDDNRAVLAFLRAQPGVDPDRIVLLGHSEGALIAAALAASGGSPALSILVSPSTMPGHVVFADQRADELRRRGATEEAAVAVHAQLIRFADFLAHRRDDRAEFEAIANDFLAAHGVPREDVDPAQAQGLLSGFLEAPWYWHFVATDPAEDLARIDTPALAVFAGADAQVPWRRHLPALVDALSKRDDPDFSAVVVPDQDHFFLEFEGRRLETHEPGRMEVAEELFAVLDAELERRGLSNR